MDVSMTNLFSIILQCREQTEGMQKKMQLYSPAARKVKSKVKTEAKSQTELINNLKSATFHTWHL